MPNFYPLTVTDVQKDTRDAVVVTLRPAKSDRESFRYVQGQYLTLRRDFDGTDVRRCYSICTGIDEDHLKVGIKKVAGGCFSTWANEQLQVGESIDAMAPMGKFFLPLEPDAGRYYLGFAGGSGITPVLSIIKTVLKREPQSRFTLVYANRSISSVMFRDELDDIKSEYMSRFNVLHVLEDDAQDIDLFTGRIDTERCNALLSSWIHAPSVSAAFICGPEPMMLAIAESLKQNGLSDEQIKFELFTSAQPGRIPRDESITAEATEKVTELALTLDGSTRKISMTKPGETVLEAALAAKMDVPFSCTAGVCSTCMAKVTEGEVEMKTNHTLEDYEVRQGYVLTCQCLPLTEAVHITYDF